MYTVYIYTSGTISYLVSKYISIAYDLTLSLAPTLKAAA